MTSIYAIHPHVLSKAAGLRAVACFVLVWALLAGCTTVNRLPAVDLSAPGWTVYEGQALWKPKAGKPPLAGELIAARHDNSDVVINFSKPPIPIFTARAADGVWHINFIESGRSFSGRGTPPRQFVWFALPAILGGWRPPAGWKLEMNDNSGLSLINPDTGEEIFVVIDQ